VSDDDAAAAHPHAPAFPHVLTAPVSGVPSGVEVLAIGNELLLGETVDTNTAWMARRLAREGIRLVRATLVGDDAAAIRTALAEALRRTGIVICTGGLGPTADDLTRDVVAGFYGRELRTDDAWLAELQRRYQKRGVTMPEINRVQALRPEGARLLPNARGTAPGIILEDEALGTAILLPGVPAEMRGLVDGHVVEYLQARLRPTGAVESRALRTTGISESALAERIDDVIHDIAPLTLAFLPGLAGVDLRLTHWGDASAEAAESAFTRVVDALRARLSRYLYAEGDEDLAVLVGRLLRHHRLTLALAESCTAGLLAKKLTDEAGASDFLCGGFVTYADEAKRDVLGVRPETLAQHGAVSEQCAREMAEGARRVLGADLALSITGIAGPGGGSADKPVGLVWFALALRAEVAQRLGCEPVAARTFVFPGDRGEIRERSAQAALDMLRRSLQRTGRTPDG
jgi:nicotinamide-nucleotide amidase